MRVRYRDGDFDSSLAHVRSVEFRKFLIGMHQSIHRHMLSDLVIDAEELADHIVLNIKRELYAQHPGPGVVSVTYPKTWWQHFKLRWFPKWLLRRYPVIYNVRKVDIQVVYPTLNIAWPQKQHIVYLADWGTSQKISCEDLLGEGHATFDR